jgi:hypothetical protein
MLEPELTVCSDGGVPFPPLALKVILLDWAAFHFAYKVISLVTAVEKLYTVVKPALLYQLSNV